jgi:hypothetical protein
VSEEDREELPTPEAIQKAALNTAVIEVRADLASFTEEVFLDVGRKLQLAGHIIGPDRKARLSPFGHGDDAAVAVALLLRIGAQLVGGAAKLIEDRRVYAGASLVRQLVEVEYLAWAFETRNEEASRWLRSSKDERQSFFSPAKLRKAASGRFRSVDYGFHCELGGHPVPGSWALLDDAEATGQLMLSDCLGHAGRVWDHVVRWGADHKLGGLVRASASDMLARYTAWKAADPLAHLPPPPASH